MKKFNIGGKITVWHKEFTGWWDYVQVELSMPRLVLDLQQKDFIDGSGYAHIAINAPTRFSLVRHHDKSFTSLNVSVLGFGFSVIRQNGY